MKPIKSLFQNENNPHSQCSKDRSNVFLLEALDFFLDYFMSDSGVYFY